jgi:transcription antitermination protein NusB
VAARSKARKRALDVLYASELRGESATEALDRAIDEGEGPANHYTADLVRGVSDHQPRIDEVLAEYSEGWTLDRMPAVDRNVLRLGIYELLYVDDVPDAVAVSEALALVRDLSTDDSPQFVNGILGAVPVSRRLLRNLLNQRDPVVEEGALHPSRNPGPVVVC